MKNEYHFDNKLYFQWMRLIHTIPLIWKQKISVETNYVVQDHHLVKNTGAIVLDKFTEREMYSVLLLSSGNIPTSQKYFDKIFSNDKFDWKNVYILPKIFNTKYVITYYILLRCFLLLSKQRLLCVHSVIHMMKLLIIYV